MNCGRCILLFCSQRKITIKYSAGIFDRENGTLGGTRMYVKSPMIDWTVYFLTTPAEVLWNKSPTLAEFQTKTFKQLNALIDEVHTPVVSRLRGVLTNGLRGEKKKKFYKTFSIFFFAPSNLILIPYVTLKYTYIAVLLCAIVARATSGPF